MIGALLSFGGMLLAAGLATVAAYETYALSTGKVPAITYIVRDKISSNPHAAASIAGLLGVFIGWLIGHLGKY